MRPLIRGRWKYYARLIPTQVNTETRFNKNNMPRQARLDTPGLLQHVMARSIERRELFVDDHDRQAFLVRLAMILEETRTQCYAWALIPNHFHLLLRTGTAPLSKVMRRLMTGYAVSFNKRHARSGHLFQNRYKSTVCEEEAYLLELIRYIHLNPLRAGLVKDLPELDRYPWSGHAVILGKGKNPLAALAPLPEPPEPLAQKTIGDVLLLFGDKQEQARSRYRQFVKDGIAMGRRPEFQGGGLVRSAGNDPTGLLGRKAEERELADARILGSGDFVSDTLKTSGEASVKGRRQKMPIAELIERVASRMDLTAESIFTSSRRREVSKLRAIVSFLAVNELGYSATDVARALSITRVSARQCVVRGGGFLDLDEDLRHKCQIN